MATGTVQFDLKSSPLFNRRRSENEFGIDPDQSRIADIFNQIEHDDDTLSKFPAINESKLKDILSNTDILFDSLIKIHSSYPKPHVDVAGILTKKYLYLISAQNYQIWKQFKDRTKIDEVIDKQFNNDINNTSKSRQNIKINEEIADILISNMDDSGSNAYAPTWNMTRNHGGKKQRLSALLSIRQRYKYQNKTCKNHKAYSNNKKKYCYNRW